MSCYLVGISGVSFFLSCFTYLKVISIVIVYQPVYTLILEFFSFHTLTPPFNTFFLPTFEGFKLNFCNWKSRFFELFGLILFVFLLVCVVYHFIGLVSIILLELSSVSFYCVVYISSLLRFLLTEEWHFFFSGSPFIL